MNDAAAPVELGTERDPPPYFAGRREELAALNKRLRHLCGTGDPSGGMALIVGVPGAGKTQLGRKFAEDAVQEKGNLHVHRLVTNTTMLKSGIDLFMAIARALGAEQAGRQAADLDTRSTGRSASIGPLRGGQTQEHARHTGSLPALLDASKHAGMWNGKALVLMVDELQTIQPEGMEALCVLHQGDHGCPILLLGVGLQHTQQVLANPRDSSSGISRVTQPIRLGSLPEPDALDAIEQNMLALGHAIPQPCIAALAAASHGFPQHIHGYLEGSIAAIARHGDLAVGASLDDALQAGDRARADYYDTRLSMLPNQNAMLAVVDAMLRQGRSALWQEEAIAAIEDASFDGEEAVREAIKHGVLTPEKGSVSFGIPSFFDHMAQLLAERGGVSAGRNTH